jgi:hypothetical protein
MDHAGPGEDSQIPGILRLRQVHDNFGYAQSGLDSAVVRRLRYMKGTVVNSSPRRVFDVAPPAISWPLTSRPMHGHGLALAPVALAAALALGGCATTQLPDVSSSASTSRATLPTSATVDAPDKALAAGPVDREVYKLTGFLSPSRNIGCMIGPTGVGCNILERNWSPPPRPADCKWDYERIFVGPGEPAHFVCAGDSSYDATEPPLAYGEAITAGSIRCESATSGINCRDVASGHGFSVSREAFQLF